MIIQEIQTEHTPETLGASLVKLPGLVMLQSGMRDRFSMVAVEPILRFSSTGIRCELRDMVGRGHTQYGNPWRLLEVWADSFELSRQPDVPFPLGGCFGYWGYGLGRYAEPALAGMGGRLFPGPDCSVGFYSSLVVWDHHLGKTLVVCTGLNAAGERSAAEAQRQFVDWQKRLEAVPATECGETGAASRAGSNMTKAGFIGRVKRAQEYIRLGHIYQVNLAQRFTARTHQPAWRVFERLSAASPAPMAGFYDAGPLQIVSSSPELFLKFNGRSVTTRPIKGTRPRSADPVRDTQLAFELQTSSKETAELVMITDLLRNDLGRVCEFGTVKVSELMALERYAHVQHLVSTVRGELREDVSGLRALEHCFPGGSVTGAPKVRAMQIIEELEPSPRGPYTGAMGYLGWNGESQLNILIRTAVASEGRLRFHAGAGIVAHSDPEAEFEETLAKARGFFAALEADGSRVRPRREQTHG